MGYAEKVALPTIIDLRAVETIPALQGPVDSDRRLEGIASPSTSSALHK